MRGVFTSFFSQPSLSSQLLLSLLTPLNFITSFLITVRYIYMFKLHIHTQGEGGEHIKAHLVSCC